MRPLALSEGINFKHIGTWEEGIQNVLKEIGIEWKGVRTVARDSKRWKALCKPSAPIGRDLTT
jgi:hypothetical protein